MPQPPTEDRKWVRASVDEAAASELSRASGIDRRAARLLVGRGVTTPSDAERFLSPRLADLPDPSSMQGLDRAADRVASAIVARERIALYGDYDVDGVTSTALLGTYLRDAGVEARTYTPKRLTEGYGVNHDAVDVLAAEGTKLLITLDCGITASGEIERANRAGIETIVVDHHRCPPELPPAYAVLNPHQPGCGYPDKGLAAAGVCFNLICGVRRLLRARGFYEGRQEPNLRRYLDLVALGTIADMVPLSGVNRILSWYGMEEIRAARRPGIRALLEVSQVRPSRTTSADVSFRLGPRVNASGRLADASVGVRMLLASDMTEARVCAETLDRANGARQQVEAEVFAAAVKRLDAGGPIPAAIVLADERWHPGVVGIVCSRLVERYQRPVVLIGEGGRGSARTARGLHLYDALADTAEHLFKFGGHRAAAGLTVTPDKLEAFRAAFLARVEADAAMEKTSPDLVYDDDLSPREVDDACARAIEKLEPFGNGNPAPLFRAREARVEASRVVGKGHLKLRLSEGPGLEAIAFSRGDLEQSIYPGRAVDLVFHLEKSEFSGVEHLELRVRDLRLL